MHMKKSICLIILIQFIQYSFAQNVGIGTTTPDASALVDMNSATKGVLFPRVTSTERNAINAPALGLMVFDIEKNLPYYYNGTRWIPLGAIDPKAVPPIEVSSGLNAATPYYTRYSSAAMAGNYAAVGIPAYDSAGIIAIGAVQLFKKTNGVWSKWQFITAPDTSQGAQFGYSIDMQGSYLVVGSPNKKITGLSDCGKVYTYKLNSGTGYYDLEGQITHPISSLAYSYFGYSVAITAKSPASGGVAVAVGAPGYSAGLSGRGSVSVFMRGANGATYPHLNTSVGLQISENMGFSIDIDSNLLVVGCPGFDTTISTKNYQSTGRIQIYRFSGTNYNTLDGSVKPLVDTSANYGYRVSLDSSTFIASGFAAGNDDKGQPCIFNRTGVGTYTFVNNLTEIANKYEKDDHGGYFLLGPNLAMAHNFCVIGITHEAHQMGGSSSFGGKVEYALIYKRTATYTHKFYTQIKAPDDQTDTLFGYAVAASGNDYMIVMQKGTSVSGENGAVYFGSMIE